MSYELLAASSYLRQLISHRYADRNDKYLA